MFSNYEEGVIAVVAGGPGNEWPSNRWYQDILICPGMISYDNKQQRSDGRHL